MTTKRNLKPFIRTLRNDLKYKRLKNSFDTAPLYQIAVETMLDEIKNLHQLRDIRRLNTSDPRFIDNIIKSNTTDQATRGRLTEIMMTALRAKQTLERACVALRHHMLVQYDEELRSFRTKEERIYVIEMAMTTFLRYIERVELLYESASLVIADIDKGSWSLRLSITALQTDRTRESNI